MGEELPALFTVEAPDDSMAPRIKAGTRVTFDKTIEAAPGDGVLVKDGKGDPYIRQYRQLRGRWEAKALNDAYASMLSDADELRVIAVLVSVASRWSAE